jgi:para-nitrobenzyl esterase
MSDDRPQVQTTAGSVRGTWRGESAAFLGIPFAEPPVGELRFAAPVPQHPWDGVRDATAYGPTAQRETLSEVTLIPEPSLPGESTLNVNVFTPRPGDEAAALPVLVYIHGGGFVAGSPASPWYDGAAFNRDGVVTVTISYRLGFDGFGWIEDAPHNRGVLDWILALQWVRDNIRSFGGDPEHVTIAGQSAGGAAVLTLLATPLAAGLFDRAISLSGPVLDVQPATAEEFGRRLAALGGVEPTRAGLSSLDELTVLALQNRVASVGGEASGEAPSGADADPLAALAGLASGALPWAPMIDGELVPEPIARAVAASEIPLLFGTTDQEFTMAPMALGDALAHLDPVAALQRLGASPALARSYSDAHAAERDALGTAGVLGQYVTDSMFRRATRALAEARAAAGTPTWLYRFSWPSPTLHGAVHCLDVPFFFDCLGAERVDYIAGPNPPEELAQQVHGAAVAFIRGDEPGWPAYATPGREVRSYGGPSTVLADGFGDVAVFDGR